MALVDETGTILVDDAGLMWRRRDGGQSGLGDFGDLGAFNWEGFGQAAAGIGGAVAGIIQAKKTGYAPISGVAPQGGGGIQASASGLGSSGGFSMSPTMMILLAVGAVVVLKMK